VVGSPWGLDHVGHDLCHENPDLCLDHVHLFRGHAGPDLDLGLGLVGLYPSHARLSRSGTHGLPEVVGEYPEVEDVRSLWNLCPARLLICRSRGRDEEDSHVSRGGHTDRTCRTCHTCRTFHRRTGHSPVAGGKHDHSLSSHGPYGRHNCGLWKNIGRGPNPVGRDVGAFECRPHEHHEAPSARALYLSRSPSKICLFRVS
jgi:hypothetical protein